MVGGHDDDDVFKILMSGGHPMGIYRGLLEVPLPCLTPTTATLIPQGAEIKLETEAMVQLRYKGRKNSHNILDSG